MLDVIVAKMEGRQSAPAADRRGTPRREGRGARRGGSRPSMAAPSLCMIRPAQSATGCRSGAPIPARRSHPQIPRSPEPQNPELGTANPNSRTPERELRFRPVFRRCRLPPRTGIREAGSGEQGRPHPRRTVPPRLVASPIPALPGAAVGAIAATGKPRRGERGCKASYRSAAKTVNDIVDENPPDRGVDARVCLALQAHPPTVHGESVAARRGTAPDFFFRRPVRRTPRRPGPRPRSRAARGSGCRLRRR